MAVADIAPPLRRQGPGFIRLCLAWAETYCLQMPPALPNSAQSAIVSTNELPLGPLGHIKLWHRRQLDKFLLGEVLDNKCGICDDPVNLKGTVFKMCGCTNRFYRDCVLKTLASVNCKKREDSHSYLLPALQRRGKRLVLSVRCGVCSRRRRTVTLAPVPAAITNA